MENLTNDAASTLASPMLIGDTTLTVVSASGFPAANFRIRVENEDMLVTNVSGTTFTVTRAQEGTSAAAHSAGLVVAHVLSKEGWDNYGHEQWRAPFPGVESGKVRLVPANHRLDVFEELLIDGGELIADGKVTVMGLP